MPRLKNVKYERFAQDYAAGMSLKQSAINAGYAYNSAARCARVLVLDRPEVQARIAELQAARGRKIEATAQRTLEELRRLAYVEIRPFFDDAGNLKPISELTEEQGAQLASVELVVKNIAGGDGKTDMVHKIKLWDKTRALEMLCKHFALLTDRVEHQGEITFRWKDSSERT